VAAASGPSLCPAQLNPAEMPTFGVEQCQPGLLDAGGACADPPVGALVQAVPIIMGGEFDNTVDAAFVSSTRGWVDKMILHRMSATRAVLQSSLVRSSLRRGPFLPRAIQGR
jgi:hypothetical protein